MRLCEYSWKVFPTPHSKHKHGVMDESKTRCKHLEHLSDEAGFSVDWLGVQKQKCGDDVKHDYLLMKPVSRISNQARREGGQCPREEKRKEVIEPDERRHWRFVTPS